MKYCSKCGMQVDDNTRFCPACGHTIEQPAAAPTGTQNQYNFSEKLHQLNDTPDTTAKFDPIDIEKNKIMAILAYIIWLIPLLAAKDSKFARFHTNQGLVVFILSIAWSVVTSIISSISFLFGSIFSLGSLLFLALMIVGIINAANGRAKELPVIGSINIIQY